MRTVLHFAPTRGWLNDPNGLIEHRGVHHLFFQHNPDELAMRDMSWGHASSPDLVTWTEHPVALVSGPPGSYDQDGCWSGCAVDDGAGVAVLYSGNDSGVQLPCLARALDDDLVTWQKWGANPVIDHRPPIDGITDMRDHSVRWDGHRWRQVIAAGVSGEGMLFGYSSSDLVHWAWDGIVLRAGDLGLPGRIWECPDVFEAGDHVVAVVSVSDGDRSSVIWVTGALDGATIVPQRWGLLDHGDRLYAPQSYSDHRARRVMFGWLRTQWDPAALGQDNLGVTSLPRILSVVDGRLHQRPAAEIQHCRGEVEKLGGTGEVTFSVPGPPWPAAEMAVECQSGEDLMAVRVDLYDDRDRHMAIDLGLFSPGRAPGDDGAERPEARGATLIFDSGIVEVFLDDGRAAALSDVRLEAVRRVRVGRGASTPVDITIWPLTAP
jgi:beta-fructofuranosidase